MARGLGTPGGVVSDEDHRLAMAGLIASQSSSIAVRTGVLLAPGASALVTGTSATGTMTVAVAAHHWVTTRGAADGVYLGALEAATTANIAAAPGANSRIDVVWVKQNDSASSISPDGSTAFQVGVTTGTAAVSPTKPSIPVGALEIATVTVAAGATATNGAGVTISNTAPLTVARGAAVPVRTKAERDALTTFAGLNVLRLDQGGLQQWHDGAKWRYEGDRVTVGNAAARTALDGYAGLAARQTDIGADFVHNGTAWRETGMRRVFRSRRTTAAGPVSSGTVVRVDNLTGSFTLPVATSVTYEFRGTLLGNGSNVGRLQIVRSSSAIAANPALANVVEEFDIPLPTTAGQSVTLMADEEEVPAGTWFIGVGFASPLGGNVTLVVAQNSGSPTGWAKAIDLTVRTGGVP